MRKLFLLLCCLLYTAIASAQPPTMEQKLYYSCKVWGFVKYYHSEVSTCKVDWDSVLMHTLPLIKSATTNAAFNDALDTMLLAAGPMALSTTYFPDTIKPALKRNRDWGWIGAPVFRSDVRTILDTIKNNFRPHASCWVENNTYTTANISALIFPHDSLGLNINTSVSFPDQDQRLFMLYKYWNIIQYFNPYNYVCDTSWDSVLYRHSVPFANVSNAEDLHLMLLKLAKHLDDAHVYAFTSSSSIMTPAGFYRPLIKVTYSNGAYIVARSKESGVYPGDVLVSIDGLTCKQWEDSLKQYYSAGNKSVLGRIISDNILCRKVFGVVETITFLDSIGSLRSVKVICGNPVSEADFFNKLYYPNDSLSDIKWTTLLCNVGYVNMGNVFVEDVNTIYENQKSKKAIIFDIRNYPNGTFWEIAKYFLSSQVQFSMVTRPDVNYPGTFYYAYNYLGPLSNSSPYAGKVIILMNENTQSHAEYSCMGLEVIPGAIKVGSQTAGADGNITNWKMTQDLRVGFTSRGIYYPNGDSTQRIGIVPDSIVYPTSWGIRRHRDEVLEKALTIAGCNIFSETGEGTTKAPANTFSIIPNPATDVISIQATNTNTEQITVTITDISGRAMIQKVYHATANFSTTMDIKTLAAGMYFVNIKADGKQYVTRLVKR